MREREIFCGCGWVSVGVYVCGVGEREIVCGFVRERERMKGRDSGKGGRKRERNRDIVAKRERETKMELRN